MKWVRLLLALASAGTLGCVAPSVIQYQRRGGIDVNDQVEYYDIRGKTQRELRIDAHVNGPVARDTTWFGLTHYQIHWTYSYYRQPTLCRLTNVKMMVDVIVTLPRWVDSSDVDPAAVYWWANSSEQVRTHVSRTAGCPIGDKPVTTYLVMTHSKKRPKRCPPRNAFDTPSSTTTLTSCGG